VLLVKRKRPNSCRV